MATVTKVIEVPAQTRTQINIVCDECGEHAWCKCTQCHADLCPNHRIQDPNDSGGDYTDYVCKSCFDILAKYKPEFEELDSKLEDLWKEVGRCCVAARKQLNKK